MTGGRERQKTLLWSAWFATGGLVLLLWYVPRGVNNLVLLAAAAAWGAAAWLLRGFLRKSPTVLAEVIQIPVERILANPYRVRVVPDPESVDGLARSIESYGMLTPILVRPRGDKYEIVDGQRRLLAAKRLGREWLPAIVRNLSDKDLLEASLLGNLQRSALSPVEEARAFSRLRREFEQVDALELAVQMGLGPDWAGSRERLLSLSEVAAQAAILGQISGEHAEALAQIRDHSAQLKLLVRTVEEKWDVERLRAEVNALLAEEDVGLELSQDAEEETEAAPAAASPPPEPPRAPAHPVPPPPPAPRPAPQENPPKPPPSYGTLQI